MTSYTVYGMDRSYFSRKLDAAMTWYGLPFEFVAKTMVVAADVEAKAGTRQVPVLVTPDGSHVPDTTPIMSMLDELVPQRRMFPDGSLGVLVHLVEEWFDEWIPRTALHYRWNFPESAAYAMADMAAQLAPDAAEPAKQMLGQGIRGWGLKACRATGVSEPAQQRFAEDEYARVLAAADLQLGRTRFLLGERPCAVDASVLGGLRAHFDADPVPRAQLAEFANLRRWIDDTSLTWDGTGELAAFPQSTGFARFVLAEMAGAFQRFAIANGAALAAGDKGFVINVGGRDVSYKARAYPQQSREMIKERIAGLPAATGDEVRAWLDELDLVAFVS